MICAKQGIQLKKKIKNFVLIKSIVQNHNRALGRLLKPTILVRAHVCVMQHRRPHSHIQELSYVKMMDIEMQLHLQAISFVRSSETGPTC